MRSPPMGMPCRLHVDTQGWDWVPSEKFSLFTSAWSVWSSSLVTCPDLWLIGCAREWGGKGQQHPFVKGPGRGGAKGVEQHRGEGVISLHWLQTPHSQLTSLRNPESSLPQWWIFSSWCSLPSWSEVKWMKIAQSCLTLCDPMDCSLPGSSVHRILQARILEWVAIPFFRGSSQPWDKTQVSGIAGRFFTIRAMNEAHQKSACFILHYLSVLGVCRGGVESTAWGGGGRWIWLA